MNFSAASKVAVPTPGTPVALGSGNAKACKMTFQPGPANTGKVYLGTPTMVKATLAGVLHVFNIPASGQPFESFEIEPHEDSDQLYLNQYAVDADVATEGLVFGYWVE